MSETNNEELLPGHDHDGVDRRGFLKCMAWAGTGAFYVMQGGVLKSYSLSTMLPVGSTSTAELSFVQISDSHMGFNKQANPDVVGTLKAAVDKVNRLATPPEFMLHTGDISHLSKPEEFDTVDQVLKSASAKDVFFVPGEHDVLEDDGKQYLERYGKGAKGAGWYSFDKKGVHFIGLVNVLNLKSGGLGSLGGEQLEWLEDDVKHLKHSTPIVVFAHIPLWTVYPEWGWGTEDSGQALSYLKKFAIDVVKLDRTFIEGLVTDPVDAEIASAVIRLSGALGIRTVAEGVETDSQRRMLVQLGCPLMQGFLTARPLPPEDFLAFWDNNQLTAVLNDDESNVADLLKHRSMKQQGL